MRLPRDISGDELIRLLERFGYAAVRQTGSHVRLVKEYQGDHHHHLTIPRHSPLRLGTLHSILQDVAKHLGVDRDEILKHR